jgi:hypothetical protein
VAGQQVVEQRDQMLVRARAGIDDVLVRLEALIGAHIPEQGVVFLDQRDDFLAGDRGDGANDLPAARLTQHGAGLVEIAARIALRVGVDGVHSDMRRAIANQLREREISAIAAIAADRGIRPAGGEQDADRDALHTGSQQKTPRRRFLPSGRASWGDTAR